MPECTARFTVIAVLEWGVAFRIVSIAVLLCGERVTAFPARQIVQHPERRIRDDIPPDRLQAGVPGNAHV